MSGVEDPRGYCEGLAAELASAAGVDRRLLTPALEAAVLSLARDIAHGTERRNAPLATFLAGRYLEARRAAGIDPEAALGEVAAMAAALMKKPGEPR